MSLLGKLSGVDKMTEVRDEAIRHVDAQLRAGHKQATYILTQARIGTRHNMGTFANWLCKEFAKAGYRVVNATESGWDYRSIITVDRAMSVPTSTQPQTTKPLPYAGVRRGAVATGTSPSRAAASSLRPFWTEGRHTAPFGAGMGLETATSFVREAFRTLSDDRLRFEVMGMANVLGGDIAQGQTSLDDWDVAAGHSELEFRQYGLSVAAFAQAIDELKVIKDTLREVKSERGQYWQAWSQDRDFVLRFFVWATVLNERMAAAGKTDTLDFEL